MLRSLLSLLLITSVNAAPLAEEATLNAPDQAEAFSLIELVNVSPTPQKDRVAVMPVIEADAAMVMDNATGVILYEKNAHVPVPMASLTKIMTALVILESHDLDEVVTVQDNFAGQNLGVRIWLNQYEKISVGNLLIGLLVRSGGDAAIALAEHHSGSVDRFVDEMNQKAQELGLQNTAFSNPIGVDQPGLYSTAYDLSILTKHALRYEAFRNIVKMPRASIASVDGRFVHEFESTNYLLGSDFYEILGVKTGTTLAAGPSLINLARGPKGQEVIAVVLNSPARFTENRRLIDWSFRNFSW